MWSGPELVWRGLRQQWLRLLWAVSFPSWDCHRAERLINTPLQRGVIAPTSTRTVSTVFSTSTETVETVTANDSPNYTSLRRGVNESSGNSFSVQFDAVKRLVAGYFRAALLGFV